MLCSTGVAADAQVELGRRRDRGVRRQVPVRRVEHALQLRALHGQSAGRISALPREYYVYMVFRKRDHSEDLVTFVCESNEKHKENFTVVSFH